MLKAVYFLDPALDPPKEDVNTFITSARLWAKDNPDKRIRLYMRDPAHAQKQLLGKDPASRYQFIMESANQVDSEELDV